MLPSKKILREREKRNIRPSFIFPSLFRAHQRTFFECAQRLLFPSKVLAVATMLWRAGQNPRIRPRKTGRSFFQACFPPPSETGGVGGEAITQVPALMSYDIHYYIPYAGMGYVSPIIVKEILEFRRYESDKQNVL